MKTPLLTIALLLAPTLASAQRCARGRADVPLPISLGMGPADFGNTPVPCGDPRVSLDLRGALLIDTADFYGALGADAVLSGTVPVARRVWLSGALTAFRYRYVQNATLLATDMGLGPADVGVHVGLLDRGDLRVSTYLRVLLPTETPTQHAARTGVEVGGSLLWTRRRLSLLAGLSLPVQLDVIGTRARTDVALRGSLDAAVLVGTWFEPVLGFEARVGGDADGAFEYIAPRLSLRAHLGRRVTLQLSGLVPVAGIERTNARFSLGLSVGL